MFLLTLAGCVSLIPLTLAVPYCPPLGPVFPSPQNVSADPLLRAAVANLSATIDALRGAGNASSAPFNSTITSFSLNFFSTHESGPLFEYHHTAEVLNTTQNGTRSVTGDTVYRLGSISKVVTVFALLLHEDKFDWRDPISKYVPELSRCADNRTRGECADWFKEIEGVRWDQVTLGALAAQLSGIPRDCSDWMNADPFGDISGQPLPWSTLGFPTLNESSIPACGLNENQPVCSREEYLSGFRARHPVYPPFATPVYSNAAFSLLGLALEVIVGQKYETVLQKDIFGPLHMSHSNLQKPGDAIGVIPVGPSGWAYDIGLDGPAGGIYSSTADLSTFARAILNSTLLQPSQTRRWLKPHTHTSSLTQSVGAPWEIGRSTAVTVDGRVVDFYTKNGGLGLYGSLMVLIPDYDLGLTVLVAGDTSILNPLAEATIKTLVPAIDEIGRAQAVSRYAGTYESGSPLNSSIRLTVDGGPGLRIASWISNGSDILQEYAGFFHPPGTGANDVVVDARLYPTGLTDSSQMPDGSSVVRQAAFRAVFQVLPAAGQSTNTGGHGNDNDSSSSGEVFFLDDQCSSWAGLDGLVYGSNAIDDFIFHFDPLGGDVVVSLESRGLRADLRKSKLLMHHQ